MPLTVEQYDALADAVLLLLGLGDDPAAKDQAKSAAYLVAELVRSYTRGEGFDADGVPAEDLQCVMITATARLVTNPAQSTSESESYPLLRFFGNAEVLADEKAGGAVGAMLSHAYSGGFAGWSEVEKAILHRYRKRAG